MHIPFLKTLRKNSWYRTNQGRAALVGLAIIVVIVIISSIWKPKESGIKPAVLTTRASIAIPSEFPPDLPLEKDLEGFQLTQSTATFDYIAGRVSYLVVFATPWSRVEAAEKYESHLGGLFRNVEKHEFDEQYTTTLTKSSDDEFISVSITEDHVVLPEDVTPEVAEELLAESTPRVRVSISYAKQ